MSNEVIYGYPCVSNPNDFSPDIEVCTPDEIAQHKADCEAWNRGDYERDRSKFCGYTENGSHVTRTPWGIGINTFEVCDECGFDCVCEDSDEQ